MKKFLNNLFLFIGFSAVFYLVALFIWGTNPILKRFESNLNYKIGSYGHMNTRLKEAQTVTNPDILFLGSSHAYRGFDTRIFAANNLNTFNLGSSAQTPPQTLTLLKRYLKGLSPKKVVYEVYPFALVSDGVESSLDIIANDKNDIYSYQMAFKLNHAKTYNTLLYATMRNVLNLDQDFVEPVQKEVDTYIKGGFVEKEIAYNTPQVFEPKEIDVKKEQLGVFEDVLTIIEESNIELVLVFAPVTKSLYTSYTNIAYYDSLMSSYGEYYNFNEMVELDDSLHFYDSNHLNQNGVELFNQELVKLFVEEGQ